MDFLERLRIWKMAVRKNGGEEPANDGMFGPRDILAGRLQDLEDQKSLKVQTDITTNPRSNEK